jgi:ferredoxin
MRILVDPEVCVSAGQCVLAAPEFFDQDNEGIVTVLDSQPPAGKAAMAEDAARLCPAQVITVLREPDSG